MESKSFLSRINIFSSELVLGTLVAVLSVFTAVAGYQSSMADSDQTKYNVQGQQKLTDANAEYLTANQLIVYDYTLYDGWYTAESNDKADYYHSSFSEGLQNAIAADETNPFSDAYYDGMYTDANAMFDESDNLFNLAEKFNERGDELQLVMLIMALGLAFAAWASLLQDDSKIRVIFGIFSIAMLIYGIIIYVKVPVVAGL